MEVQTAEVNGTRFWRFGRIVPETRKGHILLCTLLWSTITFLLVQHFVFETVVVEGQSMIPTLKSGDCYLVNCWRPMFRGYQRGDIVVVRDRSRDELVVKRIVGLPSDRLEIRHGEVHINGKLLTEPYLPAHTYTAPGKLQNDTYEIAGDCYFVLGDNRSASDDSRSFGAVRRADLVGLISR